jgi:heterodisulfide reductase subunit C
MSENIRVGKRIKEGEKGDGKCYFPCKKCCTRCPERVLIETAKTNYRKYGHMDGGSNEYCPMVISYIYIHYLF